MTTSTERRFLTTVGIIAVVLAISLIVLSVADATSARLLIPSMPIRWSWSSSSTTESSGAELMFPALCPSCRSTVTPSTAPTASVVAVVILLGAVGATAAILVCLVAFRARTGFSPRLARATWAVAAVSLASAVAQGVVTQGTFGRGASARITTFADPVWGLVGLVAIAALAACVAGVLYGLGSRLQRDTDGLV